MEKINTPSVELNKTFDHTIAGYAFGNLSDEICKELWKDGRPFSYFIEAWICENYPLTHVKKNKKYDFTDNVNSEILYDEKTFTKNGCTFCPSNMLGQDRTFDQTIFEEKTKKLILCIVSNRDFPNIKIRFVKGEDLINKYPTGKIPLKDFVEFFN
tara:strand:- start:813 stop:1280 length:468 start_codon:yes stop_codon:yes gene_type:complete